MAKILKPNLKRIWAESAPPANITDPGNQKFDDGWTLEAPTLQAFNFLQKLFSEGLAYFNQTGIPEWDALTTYYTGSTVSVGNSIYNSLIDTNLNQAVTDISKWIRVDPQAFGLGSLCIDTNDFDAITATGMYKNTGTGSTGIPLSAFFTLMHLERSASHATQTARRVAAGIVAVYERERTGGTWGDWEELYHTGNLNQFEFGVAGVEDLIGRGFATSIVNISVPLPISFIGNPASISVANTFKVTKMDNTAISTGISAIALSGLSSRKWCVLNVPVVGAVTNQVYDLRAESSASKITVNP